MDSLVQGLFDRGLAKSTRLVYQSGWRKYVTFCNRFHLQPLPVTPYNRCTFAAYMSQTASETTVRTYLSAVRFYQIRIGLPDPSQIPCPKLPYILKGIQNSTTTSTRFHRLPITPDHLRAVYNVWSTPPVLYDKVMLWAAICVGFFGFLRSGEFTATPTCNSNHVISAADISVDSHSNPQVVTITLCHSKTDQAGKGSIIYLGRTGDKVCPVTALLAYLAVRPPVVYL